MFQLVRRAAQTIACAFCLLSISAEAAIVTAEHVPADYSSGGLSVSGFNNGSFRPGQTFTALLGGLLGEVSVALWSSGANNVVVEVRDTSGGLPASLLASGLITSGPYNGLFQTVDLSSSGITLNGGGLYAITLRTVNASPNAGWQGSFAPELYTGGEYVFSSNSGATYSVQAGYSHSFRVTVEPVPEPSTFGVLGIAGMALVVVRRRRP